jgi:hypothetical protein
LKSKKFLEKSGFQAEIARVWTSNLVAHKLRRELRDFGAKPGEIEVLKTPPVGEFAL